MLATLGIVSLVLVLFVCFSFGFNKGDGGESPLLCALYHPDCSTAFATWALCAITVGTIASGFAVFALETRKQIATFICTEAHSAGELRTRNIYLVRQYERPVINGKRVFSESVQPGLRTSAAGLAQFTEFMVDIENLGRSALIDLAIELSFERAIGGKRENATIMLPLEALGDKKTMHLIIHFEASMKPRKVRLTGKANSDGPFSFQPNGQPRNYRGESFSDVAGTQS